jgi:microcystin-dependent protein
MSEPFIAEIRIFAGNFAPRNWAFCNGQLLPIDQNTALFSLVGTIYGGDGRTNFGLPNLQGRAPMHPGYGPGLSQRQLGQSGGVESVTLTAAQTPSHAHQAQGSLNDASDEVPSASTLLAATPTQYTYAGGSSDDYVDMAPDSLATTGGGQPHTNMQPYLAINFIIALLGIYPERS